MKYERFEDLPVWKSAIELAARVYSLTKLRFFSQPGDLRDQLRRAPLSVSNNIAEGFERGTTAELLAFLYIARGSAGETRSMLHFCSQLLLRENRHGPDDDSDDRLAREVSVLSALAESCSRQLRAWAESLQNSDVRGQRHLNDKTRKAYDQQQRADAFQRRIKTAIRDAHPEWFRNDEEE